MSFKWTTENLINVIELYRNAECLWNPRDKEYKNRYKKHDLWVTISNATGATVDEVKRKIKNLVAQYYREKKKYRAYQKSGAGAYIISKWFAFKYLEFLSDKNEIRHCSEKGITDSNEPYSPDSADDHDDDEGEKEYSETEKEDSETQDITQSVTEEDLVVNQQENAQPKTHQDNTLSQSDSMEQRDHVVKLQKENQTSTVNEKSKENPRTIEKLDTDFKRPKKRRGIQNLTKETDGRQEEAYMFLKELQHKQQKDHFSIFGEHVASKMRRLKTEYAQNTVEHLIGNILWEASLGKYDQPYQYHQSPQFGFHSSASPLTTPSPVTDYVSSPSPSPQMLSSANTGVPSEPLSDKIQEPVNENDILYTALSSIYKNV